MADENPSQQASEGAPEEKPATVPAPEGWDEAFGADAPQAHGFPRGRPVDGCARAVAAERRGSWRLRGRAWCPVRHPELSSAPAAGRCPLCRCWRIRRSAAAKPFRPGLAAAGSRRGARSTTAYAKSCLSAGWADCKQPGFWKKTAFMGLIELVPILNFVNQGYMLEWSKEVPFGGRTSLPQKVVTGRNFEIGFYAFVISLVFSLVAGLAGGILGWIPLIGWIATVVIGFLVAMFTYILNLRMAMRSQLGEGFKVGDAWKAIKRDWSGLLWAILAPGLIAAGVILVVSLVYTFLAVLFLIPVIGMTAYPDPAYMVSAIVGGGLGFALLTLVFAYICCGPVRFLSWWVTVRPLTGWPVMLASGPTWCRACGLPVRKMTLFTVPCSGLATHWREGPICALP